MKKIIVIFIVFVVGIIMFDHYNPGRKGSELFSTYPSQTILKEKKHKITLRNAVLNDCVDYIHYKRIYGITYKYVI